MSFLMLTDYQAKADPNDITVLTKDDFTVLQNIEPDVIQEITSHLDARYDLSKAWQNTVVYDGTKANLLNDYVYDPTGKKFYFCILAAPIATLITNTTYFRLTATTDCITPAPATFNRGNDIRVAMLIRVTVNLALNECYRKANPRMVPDFIKEAREESVRWLEKVAQPRYNVNASFLPLIQYDNPKQSNNISWGSMPKRFTNKY